MRAFHAPLPIDAALPALTDALAAGNRAVLVAPPGAGKTTRVPLVLAEESWTGGGKILVLEPRRLWRRYLVEDIRFIPIVWRQWRAARRCRP